MIKMMMFFLFFVILELFFGYNCNLPRHVKVCSLSGDEQDVAYMVKPGKKTRLICSDSPTVVLGDLCTVSFGDVFFKTDQTGW